MKKTTFQFLFMSALAALVLSACNKKENIKEAYPDAYIKSVISGGQPVFFIYHYVYSYDAMSSVETVDAAGKSRLLDNYLNGGLSFTGESERTAIPPISDTFRFNVTFSNGELKQYLDVVPGDYLVPAQNLSAAKISDTNGNYVKVTWSKVTGATAYQVNVFSNSKNIFSTDLFYFKDTTINPYYNIDLNYFTNYLPGTFSIEISALKVENNPDFTYQFDAVSIASTSLTIDR
jgi:hypothetical protein